MGSPLQSDTEDHMPPYVLNFSAIYDEEDADNSIYSLRESTLAGVMADIDAKELVRNTITFIVDIACDALWRILNIEFFHHPETVDINKPGWMRDTCREPSERDTLAANTVPIRQTKMSKDISEDGSLICEFLKTTESDKMDLDLLQEQDIVSEDVSQTEISEFGENVSETTSKELSSKSETNESIDISQPLSSAEHFNFDTSSVSSSRKGVKCELTEGFSKLSLIEKKKQPIFVKRNITSEVSCNLPTFWEVELPASRCTVKRAFLPIIEQKSKRFQKDTS